MLHKGGEPSCSILYTIVLRSCWYVRTRLQVLYRPADVHMIVGPVHTVTGASAACVGVVMLRRACVRRRSGGGCGGRCSSAGCGGGCSKMLLLSVESLHVL
jgi:hypothetical protein